MNICVFCGSSKGHKSSYTRIAKELGRFIADQGHVLIYGGGSIGLMGVLADSTLAHGGKATGIIPGFLVEQELAHKALTSLEVVGSMHDRKARMAELADVFIAAPGGMGTLDELAEMLTWAQLDLVGKPIGILNFENYFGPLLLYFDKMVDEGFLKVEHHSLLRVGKTLPELIEALNL